jgi:positive regulator of sigma E activity
VTEGPTRGEGRGSTDALSLGLNVVVAALLFGFLGHWVGKRVGAEDVLTLVGGLLGASAGFYSLYLRVAGSSREDREKKPDR